MISLGDEVRDKITGFAGIAICRHIYLNGCDRYSVQPKIDKEGKLPEHQTFDAIQLEVLSKKLESNPETKTNSTTAKFGSPHIYQDRSTY